MSDDCVLLIDDGRLAALTLAAIQPTGTRFVVIEPNGTHPAQSRRSAMVQRHLDQLDLVTHELLPPPPAQITGPAYRLLDAYTLVLAAGAARTHGVSRILCPFHVGHDVEAIGEVVRQIDALTDLIRDCGSNDETGPSAGPPEGPSAGPAAGDVLIDVPLVDLTEADVIKLADDCDVPLDAFWPCEHGEPVPCGQCASCRTWREAFQSFGLPWPWPRQAALHAQPS
ncbi:MAG: hypothetical protein EA377_06550 [Phycisphaerales bacterium]|nr:MAG: hypothetical protein EA377_06550 [Phycisphaerales bacterium]